MKFDKRKYFLFCFFLCIFLNGCVSDIYDGEICDKAFYEEYTATVLVPTVICTSQGATMTVFKQREVYYPDRWSITVQTSTEEGKTNRMVYWVSEDVFNTVKVGDDFNYDYSIHSRHEPHMYS